MKSENLKVFSRFYEIFSRSAPLAAHLLTQKAPKRVIARGRVWGLVKVFGPQCRPFPTMTDPFYLSRNRGLEKFSRAQVTTKNPFSVSRMKIYFHAVDSLENFRGENRNTCPSRLCDFPIPRNGIGAPRGDLPQKSAIFEARPLRATVALFCTLAHEKVKLAFGFPLVSRIGP